MLTGHQNSHCSSCILEGSAVVHSEGGGHCLFFILLWLPTQVSPAEMQIHCKNRNSGKGWRKSITRAINQGGRTRTYATHASLKIRADNSGGKGFAKQERKQKRERGSMLFSYPLVLNYSSCQQPLPLPTAAAAVVAASPYEENSYSSYSLQ